MNLAEPQAAAEIDAARPALERGHDRSRWPPPSCGQPFLVEPAFQDALGILFEGTSAVAARRRRAPRADSPRRPGRPSRPGRPE